MESKKPAQLVDLYLRLSIDKEGKDSLERQEADLRKWAKAEGLTVRKVWSDRGKSGYKADTKRPAFDSATKALLNGEVATLAVWKLDRLSRRGAGQIGLLMDKIDDTGGRIYFLQDKRDTSDKGDRLLIVLLSEMARSESANTSIRVRSKKEADRAAGLYLGGSAPFGYVVGDDRKLRPHPTESGLLREAVDRILNGEAMLEICRDWNRRGIPTRRRGSEWRPSTMSAIMRSPVLSGLQPEPRRTGTDGAWSTSTAAWRHPETGQPVSLMAKGTSAIISEAERTRLLDTMDARLRRYGRGLRPVKQPKSLLGGLIYCASCGRSANTFGNSYRCRRWHTDGTDCPAPLNVSISAVESAVLQMWAFGLAAHDPDSPILDAVADHCLHRYEPALLNERAEILHEIADAEARLADADTAHFARGTLPADRYERVARMIGEQIDRLRERLKDLPEPEANLGALLDPEISLPAIKAASVEEARALLRLAIERIEVTPAPKPGARFIPHERIRLQWAGQAAPESVDA